MHKRHTSLSKSKAAGSQKPRPRHRPRQHQVLSSWPNSTPTRSPRLCYHRAFNGTGMTKEPLPSSQLKREKTPDPGPSGAGDPSGDPGNDDNDDDDEPTDPNDKHMASIFVHSLKKAGAFGEPPPVGSGGGGGTKNYAEKPLIYEATSRSTRPSVTISSCTQPPSRAT